MRVEHWIAGESSPSVRASYLESLSPVTGLVVAEIAAGVAEDVDRAVAGAADTQVAWASLGSGGRASLLTRVAAALRAAAGSIAHVENAETGIPMGDCIGAALLSARYFEYFAGLALSLYGDVIDAGPGFHAFTTHEPYGVIAVITPWNAPLFQAARAIAPALAGGNTVVVKPSEFTSLSTVLAAKIATEAGLPANVFNVVTGTGAAVGVPLVSHSGVRRISFTGSAATAKAIGHVAADRIIPMTLELGGKSANIVFEDVDIEACADAAIAASFANSGQVCSAGTRLLVQSSIASEMTDAIRKSVKKMQANTELGPMITPSQFEKVQEYLAIARAEGLELLVGGDTELGEGYYVQPTVYVNVDNSSRIAREEIFGPVLAVMQFADESDAINIANDSPYGLVAGVWTSDINRAMRVAHQLMVGQVRVNTWAAPVEVPFGGYKQSGYGREKGMDALRDYTQVKSYVLAIKN